MKRLMAVATVLIATGFAATAQGAGTCTDCHGMPPIDAAYRNITTGGFKGSHQTHDPSPAPASYCALCHTGAATYTTGHADGRIQVAANINNSPRAATYSKGTFFNQTSLPVLGTCTNVNCHFESTTPVWSSAKLLVPGNCSTCHGLPPVDGNHPTTTAGAGKRHGDYYGTGTPSCARCHPDHTAEAKPFAHATSAGNRALIVSFAKGGSYSRSLAYPGYLPSQNPTRNGTCTNTYCHSPGTSNGPTYPAPAVAATWGSTFAAPCGSCHVDMSTSTTATGSHGAHAQGAALYKCAVCHKAAGSASTTLHVDAAVQMSFSGLGARGSVYSKGATFAPGTAMGTCSSSACHGSGTVTWGGTLHSTTNICEKCHGSAATNPFYSTSFPTKVTANTDARVGAHTNHLFASTVGLKIMSNVACTECHAMPAGVTGAGHFDTYPSADITFGTLAKTGGRTPTYNATTRQCSNVYCHGVSLSAATTANRTPTWNTPFLTGVATNDCGKCHGYPPASATHTGKTPTTCAGCHPHVNATGTGFVDITKHINGTVDASGGGHAVPFYNHGTATASCTTGGGGCHANASNTAPYPAAAGTPPDCRSCHVNGDPLTVKNCASCHGSATATTATAKGRPTGATTALFPNINGQHSRGDHSAGCSSCHGTYGTGRTDGTHGPGNRTASTVSTRATKVNVTLTGWNPTARTCGTQCGYSHGTKTWY